MAEFKPAFQIDTGKVIAALHAAACQQAGTKSLSFIINTGITNLSKNPDPKNLGNMNFDLTNQSGEYQVAYCRKIEYLLPIDLQKNKKLTDAFKKIEDFKEKNKDLLGSSDEKTEASVTDNSIKAKQDKAQADLKKLNDIAYVLVKSYEPDKMTPKDTSLKFEEKKSEDGKEIDYDATFKVFNDLVKSVNELRIEEKTKAEDEFKKDAATSLKTYFTNFAGKEAASKVDEKQLALRDIDADGKTDASNFKGIKDYKIDVDAIAAKVKKAEENIMLKTPNAVMSKTAAYVVGFNVEVETM